MTLAAPVRTQVVESLRQAITPDDLTRWTAVFPWTVMATLRDEADLGPVARELTPAQMRALVTERTSHPDLRTGMDGDKLRSFAFAPRPLTRIYQFDRSRGVKGFPQHPSEVISRWRGRTAV